MTEDEARRVLMACRWPRTGGCPVCPRCNHDDVYAIRTRATFCWKRCRKDVSITSWTIFCGSRASAKDLILAACIFVGGAKGISGLQLSRYMRCQYKTSFVLAHKMREAMQRPDLGLGGVAQVDGCTIGGHGIAENLSDESGKRLYRRKYENGRVVVVVREPFGKTKAFAGKKEPNSVAAITDTLAPDVVVHADGSRGWNGPARSHTVVRVVHDDAYSQDGVHTNWAESYFRLLRKMHYGTHHQISARYLEAYVNKLAWRQDHREMAESEKARLLLTLCLNSPPSREWSGYWQRKSSQHEVQNAPSAEP
jgi:hypothetical protein